MRISGGTYRGRTLSAPKDDRVRPATDKVRQAVFNMLLKYGLPMDADVIDLFCGTGSWGLEAISRGASSCLFIDNSAQSVSFARKNAESFGCEDICNFIKADAQKLKPIESSPSADLVFMDPPYKKGLVLPALQSLLAGGFLADDVIIVIESEKNLSLVPPDTLQLIDSRQYGETQITLLSVLAAHP